MPQRRRFLDNLLYIPSSFDDLRGLTLLSFTTLVIISVLGLALTVLSDRMEFVIISMIMTVCSAVVVLFLAIKMFRTRTFASTQEKQALSYMHAQRPQVLFDLQTGLLCPNLKAQEIAWWGCDFEALKNTIVEQEKFEIFLIHSRSGRYDEAHFTLTTPQGGSEVWRFKTEPLDKISLWTFKEVTQNYFQSLEQNSRVEILERIFDKTGYGMFSINEKGEIILCNPTFANWLGYEPFELMGTNLIKILSNPSRDFKTSPQKLMEITGYCDFLSSARRTKTAYIDQAKIPYKDQFITFSWVSTSEGALTLDDMKKLLSMAPIPVVFLNLEGEIQDSNGLFKDKIGSDHPLHDNCSFLSLIRTEDHEAVRQTLKDVAGGQELSSPLEVRMKNNDESVASVYVAYVGESEDRPGGFFLQFHDISEQKKLEIQLVQSQKMQAVGQLAGGIAHDFNNLLTAMVGFCDLLLQRFTPGDQSFTDIMQIKQNANRAANLVRQLLAFSRQQTLQPKVLDLNDCLAELSALLRRLIGSNIELKFKHSRDLGLVKVDQGQFEQVIINMVVNARDAMGEGGAVTICTSNAELKKAKRKGGDTIPAGSYVLIEIIDTGHGISDDHLDRIFDPFFSTKGVGEGTGLGLSTVYGIVRQTGGFILVETAVGSGTKFSIYIPRHMAKEELAPVRVVAESKVHLDLTGSQTILLVEDEDAVRLFSARALRSKGYKVIEAANGLDALDQLKNYEGAIDLVITDVVMPQMDGPTFINSIAGDYPDLKVIFISGYTEDSFRNRVKDEGNIEFLAKPFSLTDLAVRVKEVLSQEVKIKRKAS